MSVLDVIESFWAAVFRQEHGLPEPSESTEENQEELPL